MKRTVCALAAAGMIAGVFPALSPTHAGVVPSDPMGVYCILDKVVLEPATEEPLRAQLWGVCAVANSNDWYFQPVARGYFYYSIPTGKDQIVLREWADLKSVAGTGEAVGFGRRYQPVGRFRKAEEAPASPDVYPLNIGVVKMNSRNGAPEVRDVIVALQAARTKKGGL
jgi:hypothetical protein